MGVIVPQYSDASGIYDASNQIEWRAAVSFAFYLPKEPAASIRLLAVINFFAFSKPQSQPPTTNPCPTVGIKNCAKLSAFCTFSSLIINGCCSLTLGEKKSTGLEKLPAGNGGGGKISRKAMEKSRDWGPKEWQFGGQQ